MVQSARRSWWDTAALLCLTTSVHQYRALQPRGVAEPLRYDEEGLGRETVAPQTAVGLARLRSRRPVEAADATDDDIPGHGEFQVLRRPERYFPGGLP